MGSIKYILKRLRTLNFKAMIEKINSIHKKINKSRLVIYIDMLKCAILYGAGYMDYDLFEMYNLNSEQRNTYLTRGRNNELVLKYCNKSYLHLFKSKYEFYSNFSEFLNREWVKFDTQNKEKIYKFIENHDEFILKPINGSCGKGIEKIKRTEYSSIDEIYKKIKNNNIPYILEEVIQQHDNINKIYPDAINTVRIVTILTTNDNKSFITLNDEEKKNAELVTHIVSAMFRIGNGKHVDNFNSGGMVSPVDEKNGIVIQPAIDKKKKLYEIHPITKTAIKGFKIPYWNEIIEMCSNAAKQIPEIGYIGWDVAITSTGPVLVEGNEFPGHDIYQLPAHTPNKIGVMPKFTNLN